MSSTFKNRVPKRKYRQRSQPANRQKLGLLQKKKDYKQRAKNYHGKTDKLKEFQLKASLKNQDQFYFKMVKGKKDAEGKHIELSDEDSNFDEKDFRKALKTENYNVVKMQRAIAKNKVDKLKQQLNMMTGVEKQNSHKFFIDNQNQEDFQNFSVAQKFKTLPQLAENNMLDINPKTLEQDIETVGDTGVIKQKLQKLSNYVEKERKLTKLMSKIGYEKNLLGKQRKKIKKAGKVKYHKFFIERKK